MEVVCGNQRKKKLKLTEVGDDVKKGSDEGTRMPRGDQGKQVGD